MRGILMQHHRISPNPPRRTASFAVLRTDAASPRRRFLRSSCSSVRAEEGHGISPPQSKPKRRSREELIVFFRDLQTSIAMESSLRLASGRRKPSMADPFQEAARRQQPFEELNQDGQPWEVDLEDMMVAELRALARSRRMRGYSKLKKTELIDRLRSLP